MAFIHPQSCPCTKSEVDLFSVPPTQVVMESARYVECQPIASIAQNAPIEFSISGSGNEYMDLGNSMLNVKIQITQADGTPIDNTHQVAPINLILHSIFSDLEVKLNETVISTCGGLYPYRCYIETLLSFGSDAKSSQLQASGYAADVAGHFDETDPMGAAAQNRGLIKDLCGKLHFDLSYQDKLIPSDVGLRIRLTPSKDAFCLMAHGAQPGFKVKILEARLLIRKVRISDSLYLAHAKGFQHGNARFPLRRVAIKSYSIPQGLLSHSQEGISSGQLPTRMVLGFVENNAMNGTYNSNPFHFKHFGVTDLKIWIGGQADVHVTPLEMNYETN